jgi:hypothetical protein
MLANQLFPFWARSDDAIIVKDTLGSPDGPCFLVTLTYVFSVFQIISLALRVYSDLFKHDSKCTAGYGLQYLLYLCYL